MACHESEVLKRIGVNPTVAKAFWNKIGTHLEAGVDPVKAVERVADEAGLKPETVSHILTADKRMFAITRDMLIKRSKQTQVRRAAQDLVDKSNTPLPFQVAKTAWDATRRTATFAHGGVFPFTHARNLLYAGVKEAAIFRDTVKRAYSYADVGVGKFKTSAGEARWQRDMEQMQSRSSYKAAAQAGLEIKPETEPVGILTKGMKGWGKRGFDSLKIARLDLWDHLSEKYPDSLRDEQSARALANEINVATGGLTAGTLGAQIAGKTSSISFAPKLFIARRIEALTPIRYLAKGGRMTMGERAAANIALKRWGKIVGVTAATLAANDAFNKYVLKNDKRVNWSDFSHPGSLWRYNIGGHIIPASPLTEVIRTPVAALGALVANRKELRGEKPLDMAWSIATKDILNAVHPSITSGIELITGREQFGVPGKERRLPFPGLKQLVRGEEPEKVAPMSGAEYAMSKGPIPLSAGSREFLQTISEEDIPDAAGKGLLQAILSGGLGLHSHTEGPKPVKSQKPTMTPPRMKRPKTF